MALKFGKQRTRQTALILAQKFGLNFVGEIELQIFRQTIGKQSLVKSTPAEALFILLQITSEHPQIETITPGVNFIDILCTHFSYKIASQSIFLLTCY